jgi:lipoprotein-releasing system permease protein
MKLPFRIALRFLTSNKGQTILIALGIAVGVSVQIFIGSLIQGLQKSLVDKTIGNSSQITITSDKEDKKIKDYNQIMNTIKTADDRIINISASADGPGLIKKDSKTYSILLRGFNLEDSNKIYGIKDKIYEGSEPSKDYEVLIGKDLKEELKLKIGDSVDIIANTGSIETVKVTGFYDLNVATLNKSWMITNLSTAQKIFKYDSSATSIEMQVKEVFKADEIAAALSSKLSSDYKDIKVDNWKAQNAQLLSGLNGQSVSSIMIQVFVLIAVVLGIASVLAITVLQKSKQIGILKAMGIKDSTASLIFLFQGLLLGVLGAILGVLLGLGLSFSFTKFALNPDGTPVVALYIDYGFIALSALIALASSTLAALIPARRSSKLNPIEVIRNG